MTALWTALGVLLMVVAAYDAFATLLDPSNPGPLNRVISRGTFRALRAVARRLAPTGFGKRTVLALAGPVALYLVIVSWAVLLAFGAALLYLPHLPEQFLAASGLSIARQDDIFDALYFSLSNLTTLGIGDLTPRSDWLRVVTVAEALGGVALITSAVSWLLVTYTAVARKRTLAQMVAVYLRASGGSWTALLDGSPERATALMAEVTSRLAALRADLVQFPIVYAFEVREERVVLPSVLVDLSDLAEAGGAQGRSADVRFEARALSEALAIYAAALRDVALGGEADTRATLERYADDHLVNPARRHGDESMGGEGS